MHIESKAPQGDVGGAAGDEALDLEEVLYRQQTEQHGHEHRLAVLERELRLDRVGLLDRMCLGDERRPGIGNDVFHLYCMKATNDDLYTK